MAWVLLTWKDKCVVVGLLQMVKETSSCEYVYSGTYT